MTVITSPSLSADAHRLRLQEELGLQAPPHVDPDTVAYPALGALDFEQGGLPLRLPATSSSKALAVTLGTNKSAMWFGTRADGTPALWMDQTGRSDALMTIANPGLLLSSPTVWSFVAKVSINTGVTTRIFRGITQIYSAVDSTGRIQYFDGAGNGHTSASTLTALLGWQSGDDVLLHYKLNGTALVIEGSLDGLSWTTITTNTMPAVSDMSVNPVLYLGLSAFVSSNCFRGQWLDAKLHDGDRTDPVVAHFTPSLFPAGNRTNAATAVDAYDVTWTLTKPTATSTDEPKVILPGARRFVMPGVSGESVAAATPGGATFAAGFDVRVRWNPTDGWSTPTTYQTLAAMFSTVGQRCWLFDIPSAAVNPSALRVGVSGDGSSVPVSAHIPISGDIVNTTLGPRWLRARYNAATGFIEIFHSFDADEETAVWVAGPTATGTPTVPFAASTSPLGAGTNNPINGELYLIVARRFDGTLVERITPDDADPDSYTFLSSTTGATVTVNHSTAAGYKVALAEEGDPYLLFDGVNDFARIIGDLSVMDFDPTDELTLVADVRIHNTTPTYGRVMSAENTSNYGASIQRVIATPALMGRVHDGTTGVQVGDNGDNITYGVRSRVVAAFGSSDHEMYTAGVSRESATTAVAAEPATELLHFGRTPSGAGPLAFELHGFVILKRRLSGCDAATITTEMGL